MLAAATSPTLHPNHVVLSKCWSTGRLDALFDLCIQHQTGTELARTRLIQLQTTLSAQMEHGDTSVKTCNFLKPKIVIRLVDDTTVYPKQAVPGDIYPYLQVFLLPAAHTTVRRISCYCFYIVHLDDKGNAGG